MYVAEIQTRWVGDGNGPNLQRPAWADSFKHERWVDMTGQPAYSDPNIYTIRGEADLDQINLTEESPDFWVNWAQSTDDAPLAVPGIPMEGQEPSQERHDAMRAWQTMQGFSQQFVDDTLGPAPAGRSAGVIGETVYVAQREMPPGVPPYPYMLTIEVTREPGWQDVLGWRAVLLDWIEEATPAATAMAVYDRPDCDTYLFTSGAFVEQDGVWSATCPAGFEPGDADVYFGVLYGSVPFACFTLPQGVQSRKYVVNGDPS